MVSADDYGIAFDGSVDVTIALASAIAAQPSGSTFTLHPAGLYLSNPTTSAPANQWIAPGVTIDGLNATLFRSVRRTTYGLSNRNSVVDLQAANMTVKNLNVLGFRKDTYTGNKLTTVAGSPTVVGTGVELNANNEAVRLPNTGLDYNILHDGQWMNTEVPFYFRQITGLVKFEATLSDTTQVANDCVFAIVRDSDSTVLASSTLTLTAVPTLYTLTFDPAAELDERFRIQVKKATATANVITVASITAYGEAGYRSNNVPASDPFDGGDEFSHGFEIGAFAGCTVQDCTVEGMDGDGFNVLSSATNPHITGCSARATGRHGYVVERPIGGIIEDSSATEAGRSGIDFEPNSVTWAHHDIIVRNMTFNNIRNYVIASSQWARGFNLTLQDITSTNAGMGPLFGGAVGMTIERFDHSGTYRIESDRIANGGYADADFICFGIDVTGADITTEIGFRLPVITRTYDPPGAQGVTTYTPDNIHLTNVSILNPTSDPPWQIDTTNSSIAYPGHVAVWDSTTVVWDDPNVTWGGELLSGTEEITTMQSVATFAADGFVGYVNSEVLAQSVATFFADGTLVLLPEATAQTAVTFEADGTLASGGVQEGEVTMQAVVELLVDGHIVQPAEATMQAVTTFSADSIGAPHEGETDMQSAAFFMLAEADIRQRATGEWYIRGGTFYPPPFNRRKMMQRAHLGTGRRIG